MRIKMIMAGMAALGTLSLGACDWPTACEGLTASDQDREAAANGYEVEREDSMGNTCELSRDGQSWEVDD